MRASEFGLPDVREFVRMAVNELATLSFSTEMRR